MTKKKKQMPKLPNKSISLVVSAIVSVIVSYMFTQKIQLFLSNAAFGQSDPIFGLDIGYYIFQKPVIEGILTYLMWLIIGLSIYMAAYYIITFNRCFNGVDRDELRESLFMKKLERNIILVAIIIGFINSSKYTKHIIWNNNNNRKFNNNKYSRNTSKYRTYRSKLHRCHDREMGIYNICGHNSNLRLQCSNVFQKEKH